jgi:putative sterol carrier protein
MAKYLTQEWLDQYATLSQDQPTRPGASVAMQYHVTGGPDGDIDYYWVLDEGRISEAKLGAHPSPGFTLNLAYDDAAKVQKGELDPSAAFMQGKMKVTGNMAKLMSLLPLTNSPEWKALEEKIRADTDF